MTRRNPERGDASSRDRLLDVAEALYAVHGFSGVSFRQICAAAGARNNFAVQYHFGDLEQLATAILERRFAAYEMRRGALLAEAARHGPLTPRLILEILQRPIIELVDPAGTPFGARFMAALQNTSWGWKSLSRTLDDAPVTGQLIKSLEALLPDIPPPVIWQRLYLTSQMIVNCVAQIPAEGGERFRRAVVSNAFAMAAAAIAAPIDPDDADAMLGFRGRERALPGDHPA